MLPMLEYLPEKRATAAEMLEHPWLSGGGAGGGANGAANDAGTAPPHGHHHRSPSPSPPSPRGGGGIANGGGGVEGVEQHQH